MIKRKNLLYRIVISLVYAFVFCVVGCVGYFCFGLFSAAQSQSDLPADSSQNLMELGQGIKSYANDHNGMLPDMMLQKTFKQQVFPYVKSDAAFASAVSKESLQPNWRLEGMKTADLKQNTVVMFDPTDDTDEHYIVLFGSWDASKISKSELDKDLEIL